MIRTLMMVAGLSLSVGAGIAVADDAKATDAQRGDPADQKFLETALGVNQLELQLGQLARKRATTAEVKAMGGKMVDKHTAFGAQLAALAKASGGSGVAAMSADQRATYARVTAQTGAAFDTVFKQVVDAGHVDELAMYRVEVPRANGAALRDLAKARVAALEIAVANAKTAAAPAPAPAQDW
jgi:putative membrane protein